MTRSMTGFAVRDGVTAGWSFALEIRSVNGRGLDLRLRLPDWIEGLEQPVREAVKGRVARGNVTVSLRAQRAEDAGALRLSEAMLAEALGLIEAVEQRAIERDIALAPSRAADVLAIRGVIDSGGGEEDSAALAAAILAELPPLLEAFDAMRGGEGAKLAEVIAAQVDEIEAGVAAARALLPARSAHVADTMQAGVARLLSGADVDPARLEQELAMLAVKGDVAEELDRLEAHVAAARALLQGPGPKGRKLDFLSQEFNREANTLCAKAGYADLTRIGLDLKHAIDQMREQIQNVE